MIQTKKTWKTFVVENGVLAAPLAKIMRIYRIGEYHANSKDLFNIKTQT